MPTFGGCLWVLVVLWWFSPKVGIKVSGFRVCWGVWGCLGVCRGVQGVYGGVLGGVYGGCLGCVLGEEEGGRGGMFEEGRAGRDVRFHSMLNSGHFGAPSFPRCFYPKKNLWQVWGFSSCLTFHDVKNRAGPPGQVLKELRDARLLLVRIPPSCFPDVLHYGRHWELSLWRLVQFPPLRDRAASNRGPSHCTVLTGSSLHGGPQCTEPSNTARTAASAALCTTPTCQFGTYG